MGRGFFYFFPGFNPRARPSAEPDPMPRVRIPVQGAPVRHDLRAERIQVDEEVVAVLVIAEAGAAFAPPHPAVVEGVRGIQARAARQSGGTLAEREERSNAFPILTSRIRPALPRPFAGRISQEVHLGDINLVPWNEEPYATRPWPWYPARST
jgi:hypothetical protein